MAITKTEYILRSLTKISNKKWEFFIISRIIHQLDNDIEFITQQMVRNKDGSIFLTDLFFPQFNIHVEIDEPFHKAQKTKDIKREIDIIEVTGHKVFRINIERNGIEKSLDKIKKETDLLVEEIQTLKTKAIENNRFSRWNFEERYSSLPIIKKGALLVDDNVVFKTQVEAMRCFGFSGNGYQRGAWTIPDGSFDTVWFPRLFTHGMWKNQLVNNGTRILEEAIYDDGYYNPNALLSIKKQLESEKKHAGRKHIVFAKSKDNLGFNLLRYVGTFVMNVKESSDNCLVFDRLRVKELIRKLK